MRWSENGRARPRPTVSPRLGEKVEPRKEWAHLWAPGPACQHPALQRPRRERGGGRKPEHAGRAGCGCQARGRERRGDQKLGVGEAGGPARLERRPGPSKGLALLAGGDPRGRWEDAGAGVQSLFPPPQLRI